VNIIGIGIDLVEVKRIEKAVENYGERFLNRIYTDDELRVAEKRKNNFQYLALRFAAKEAVMKALGYGWSGGICWKDIECINEGKPPEINLYGRAKEIARDKNYRQIFATTSHTDNLAVCKVIITG
jgi:holo-[acyl-carrier protein] synthase